MGRRLPGRQNEPGPAAVGVGVCTGERRGRVRWYARPREDEEEEDRSREKKIYCKLFLSELGEERTQQLLVGSQEPVPTNLSNCYRL